MSDAASPVRAPMRRDARAHRAALIDAATAAFETHGYLVPLDSIAERAGIGRGTLYRNFPDRMALVIAVFERVVEEISGEIDPALSFHDAVFEIVLRGERGHALFSRLVGAMPDDATIRAAFASLEQRITRFMAPIIARARDKGEVRADLDDATITLTLRMVSGLLMPHMPPAERDDTIRRGLKLLLEGLRPH
ncbi:MAG: TetR/AcrR family transcriptional regulator [Sphingomonas sp.]